MVKLANQTAPIGAIEAVVLHEAEGTYRLLDK
jgi:hypothetical protein